MNGHRGPLDTTTWFGNASEYLKKSNATYIPPTTLPAPEPLPLTIVLLICSLSKTEEKLDIDAHKGNEVPDGLAKATPYHMAHPFLFSQIYLPGLNIWQVKKSKNRAYSRYSKQIGIAKYLSTI